MWAGGIENFRPFCGKQGFSLRELYERLRNRCCELSALLWRRRMVGVRCEMVVVGKLYPSGWAGSKYVQRLLSVQCSFYRRTELNWDLTVQMTPIPTSPSASASTSKLRLKHLPLPPPHHGRVNPKATAPLSPSPSRSSISSNRN